MLLHAYILPVISMDAKASAAASTEAARCSAIVAQLDGSAYFHGYRELRLQAVVCRLQTGPIYTGLHRGQAWFHLMVTQ